MSFVNGLIHTFEKALHWTVIIVPMIRSYWALLRLEIWFEYILCFSHKDNDRHLNSKYSFGSCSESRASHPGKLQAIQPWSNYIQRHAVLHRARQPGRKPLASPQTSEIDNSKPPLPGDANAPQTAQGTAHKVKRRVKAASCLKKKQETYATERGDLYLQNKL